MSPSVLLLASSLTVIALATTVAGRPAKTDQVFVFPTTVRIINNLAGGNQVTVHCKSKDDDLGPHMLAENQSWDWTFRVNFPETTLFFCGFTTIDSSASFDIYDADRDGKRCPQNCNWSVRNDGVYGFKEEESKADIIFPWPKLIG